MCAFPVQFLCVHFLGAHGPPLGVVVLMKRGCGFNGVAPGPAIPSQIGNRSACSAVTKVVLEPSVSQALPPFGQPLGPASAPASCRPQFRSRLSGGLLDGGRQGQGLMLSSRYAPDSDSGPDPTGLGRCVAAQARPRIRRGGSGAHPLSV
jgi:hypothetical protein